MMHRLTIFGKNKFSLTVISDVMQNLGNGALGKKGSDGFQSQLPKISLVALSLSKTRIMMPNKNVIINMIWDKVFKNLESKRRKRQPLKNLK